jgi:serine/threonine protein phosphatase 1
LAGEVIELRDNGLEGDLQSRLDNGRSVWVVGDVHGHFRTLESLVGQLDLGEWDAIVMLGDLIDRGPKSAHVVRYVRGTDGVFSIRGNHEQMMIEGFDESSFFKYRSIESRAWYHNGGVATEGSYISLYGKDDAARAAASSDVRWMSSLATEVVLDRWRLVHAGYDQNLEVEDQDEGMHMNARSQFYTSKRPVDPKRTILFGHTPTFKHLHGDGSEAGEVWRSDVELGDGRPMAIGMDTCVYHGLDLPRVLSAFNLRTGEVVYQNRV